MKRDRKKEKDRREGKKDWIWTLSFMQKGPGQGDDLKELLFKGTGNYFCYSCPTYTKALQHRGKTPTPPPHLSIRPSISTLDSPLQGWCSSVSSLLCPATTVCQWAFLSHNAHVEFDSKHNWVMLWYFFFKKVVGETVVGSKNTAVVAVGYDKWLRRGNKNIFWYEAIHIWERRHSCLFAQSSHLCWIPKMLWNNA